MDSNFVQTEEKPKPKKNETENSVYITTFKSVQNQDGENIIQSENILITEEEGGVLIEEVLSDTEPIKEHEHITTTTTSTTPYTFEIIEDNSIPGDFLINTLYI